MRWRAELHLDDGPRELVEEMGVKAGLSTADGLFDVELKGKERQAQVERAVQSKAYSYFRGQIHPSWTWSVSSYLTAPISSLPSEAASSNQQRGWESCCCCCLDSCPTSLS